jgi:alpha-D-ribose 1-methylphosphonate 5-triphosphate synthase subunit PhnH
MSAAEGVTRAGSLAQLVPGFADPVHDAQTTFRAILDAVAHPGRVVAVPIVLVAAPPGPLAVAAAAVALTLCDLDTPLWLDPALVPAASYLAFHCGAPAAKGPAEARFAFFAEPATLPPLHAFALGTDEFPDRSTTLIIEVGGLGACLSNVGLCIDVEGRV